MKKKEKLRIICPNGHLGFACTKEESFYLGAKTEPDYIAVTRAVMISDRRH